MKNTVVLIIVLAVASAVLGQRPLGRFTESPVYYGQVYKYQSQHTRILQLSVVPLVNNFGLRDPPELQDIAYFSNDIDSQFYLHSRTGRVMVDAIELTEGNYTFTAYANYTTIVGDIINATELLSVMVDIRVMPEFYFVGTEQDGRYLAYVSTNAPVGTQVTRVIPQFTLLNQTMFNCSLDEEESSSLPIILTSAGSLQLTGTSNTAGLLELGVLCLAYGPSLVVIESLRVHVTIVFYQLSDLDPSDLTFNSISGVITWTPPQVTRVSNIYQRLFPLASYVISVGVANGDENSISGPISLSPSLNSFNYHPLIPRTNLNITLTAVFVSNIRASLKFNAIITAGVDLAPPQSIRIRDNSHVAGRLTVYWESPSLPPVNVIEYTLRLSYFARFPYHNESVLMELIQSQAHNATSFEFNQLPGDTSYSAVVVALYSNGQRVPASPVQYTLSGYAPSDSPNITMVQFIPELSSVMVIWSTLFFSNGEITNYIIQLVDESSNNSTMTVTRNGVTSLISVTNGFINATVRASNQYGDGPTSLVRRISTNAVPVNVVVKNITDTSACFNWSSPPDTKPFGYFIQINGDKVATTIQTSYCEMQIAADSLGRVNIGAIYNLLNSSLSSPVMFHTVQAPHNFTALFPSNESVILQWSPPEFPNAMERGIYIDRYELNINIAIRGFPDIYGYPVNGYPVNATGMNSSTVFDNLLPGVTYNLTLVAVFSNGAIATSSPVNFTTLVNVPPNIYPRNLILSYNISSTLAAFQWDPVLYSNGPVTGYKVYIEDSDGIFVQGAYNTSLEVNVRRDVSIQVRVVAVNYAGESRVANVQVIPLNAAPGALRAHLLNMSSVRLFWDPPQLFIVDFMHYLLNIFFNGIRVVDPVIINANSYVYTGLHSSSRYSFQVVAVYHSTAVSSYTVSIETPVACNASCQFGGICVAGPNICDCTSVSYGTGGTDDCYGGRANASCNCVCYDGLFTGENCTESVYGPTLLLEPSMHSVILTIIPRTPAVASTDIVGYRILIYGPFADEISLSENIRSTDLYLSVENFPYTVIAQARFYIPEHDDTFIFNASSDPLTLAVNECGPNMYGGFNNSDCQPCPENTGNLRGYNYVIESCGCLAGYTGQNGGPCNGSSDDGMMMIIIIACVAGGATIVLLLLVCCSIFCVVRRRRRSNKAKISESTKKMIEDSNDNHLNPVFKKVSSDIEMNVLKNPSFLGESKEHAFDGKEETIEYTYEDMGNRRQQGSSDNYKAPEKENFDMANQAYEIDRLATPDDYANEALYKEMTARYYEICQSNQLKLPEVSRNKVTLLEQLGTGEFGRVLKGIGSEIVSGEPETIVAVKLLKEGASNDDKKNFLGEANLMSQFHHPNVLTLLGVVTVDEPVLVIIPFMINGDLQSFLSKSQSVQLKYEDKLNISVQIATGMEYLAARFFIHRDLAARNILVGDQLHVKISDFGLSRALKDNTYYKLSSTTKLPVKWMALECIQYQKFSTFSDVWSYGVVLWEIFSLGMKPYKGVPSMTMLAYLKSGKRLTKPADCTDEIYDLMSQCWLEQKDRRPTFTKLRSEITELLNKEKN